MSTHAIEIVEIGNIWPHPDLEVTRMEVTKVWGWQCCIGKGQFKSGDKAVYVPPDFTVPLDRPEFSFLQKPGATKPRERIRVRRLRGQLSQGLLIPVPESHASDPVGTDVMEALGIERFEPVVPMSTSGMFTGGPSGLYCPKFDVENYQRYPNLFSSGEEVIVTEKIHGANARYVYAKDSDGQWQQFCGSRNNWMARDDKNIWWKAIGQCPAIGQWCEANPEKILFGEVFGQVQDLKYGASKNQLFFAAFAVLDKQQWIDYGTWSVSCDMHGVPCAPVVHYGPFDASMLLGEAEGESLWPTADHMREGVVILPAKERVDEQIGRVCLKMVSNRYLES